MTAILRISLSCLLAFSVCVAGAQIPNDYVTQQQSLPCLNKRFSLRVHVIDSPDGPAPLDTMGFRRMIDRANEAFAPICISFEDCEYRRIENYRYHSLENLDTLELVHQYGDPNRIDVFIPVLDSFPVTCGYATFRGIAKEPEAYVAVVNDCIADNPGELTHVLGHYFGLYDTYETRFGPELVNGDNCETAGDLVCDTPADPFIENSGIVYTDQNDPCLFTFTGRDAAGLFYVPHVANAMSLYSDGCGCGFTRGQLERIAEICTAAPGGVW